MKVVTTTENFEVALECVCGNQNFGNTGEGYQCLKCGVMADEPYWERGVKQEEIGFETWATQVLDEAQAADEAYSDLLHNAFVGDAILHKAQINRAQRTREECRKRAEVAELIKGITALYPKGKMILHLPGEGGLGFIWGGYSDDDLFAAMFEGI